ncbi:MAG: chemotaxis protein CheC [Proteobacteria bacterium]|nr:chemotaxis protein CheC [Pseudomonadota bacterium]MBU1711301.1 chemotaxis protein CheC [Pseudomonadota bacterium]
MLNNNDIEILQEVMNIAFGKASADLAEVIDIRVFLNVPYVELLNAADLPRRIVEEVKMYKDIRIVEQNYWGKFKGSALLIFPAESGKGLISLFEDDFDENMNVDRLVFEKETLLEVGNILIGACVGKIAELLDDVVSYSPPNVTVQRISKQPILERLADPEKHAIFMKTVFQFEDKDVSGALFLISGQDSLTWLKTALNNFMAKFG